MSDDLKKTLENGAVIAVLLTVAFFLVGPTIIYWLIDLARSLGAN